MKNLFLLLILLAAGCGSDRVTLNVGISAPQNNQKSFTQFAPIFPCVQNHLFAGIDINPQNNSTNIEQIVPVPLVTSFPDYSSSGPSGLAELMNLLTPAALSGSTTIKFQVPRNVPIEVGFFGLLDLVSPTTFGPCGNNTLDSDWAYAPVIGSVKLTPTENTTVNVPAVITRKIIQVNTISTGVAYESPQLETQDSRHHYMAVTVQPPSGLPTYASLTLEMRPGQSGNQNNIIKYPLIKYNTELHNNFEPSANYAFAIPHLFPITFTFVSFAYSKICKKTIADESGVVRYWHSASSAALGVGEKEFATLVVTGNTGWVCDAL